MVFFFTPRCLSNELRPCGRFRGSWRPLRTPNCVHHSIGRFSSHLRLTTRHKANPRLPGSCTLRIHYLPQPYITSFPRLSVPPLRSHTFTMRFRPSWSSSVAALLATLCFSELAVAIGHEDNIRSVPLRTHSLTQVKESLEVRKDRKLTSRPAVPGYGSTEQMV